MTTLPFTMIALCTTALLLPGIASAQQRSTTVAPLVADAGPSFAAAQQSNVPPEVKQAESAVKSAVRRYRIGVFGGVALDPELIEFGAHGSFGPFFGENIEFRPGFDLGVGEVTTQLGINLDVLYSMSEATTTQWTPYIGIGGNFGFSHQSFVGEDEESGNRFDFGDTDVEGGMNFIVGMKKQSGLFFEMRATAYGVSAIRLLGGFNF